MAIKATKDSVSIEVRLDYNEKQAQRIAQNIDSFQRKQQQQAERHQDKLRQSQETHQQRLKQMEERANKQAEIRAKQHQARLLKGTKTWSAKMLDSINSIKTAVIAMGVAFVSAKVIGGIKQLATESLSLASDVNTLAKATGLQVESLSQLRGVANVTGVQFTTLQASFSAITAKLEDARRGSREAQASFQALGIDFRTATLDEVIGKLYDASQNTENLGKVAKVAGNEASTAFAKMGTFAGSFDELKAKAGTAFGALDTKSAESLNSLSDKLEQIKLQVSYDFTNALGNSAPKIEDGLDRIGQTLEKIDWDKLIANLVDLSEAMVNVGVIGLPKVATGFRTLPIYMAITGASINSVSGLLTKRLKASIDLAEEFAGKAKMYNSVVGSSKAGSLQLHLFKEFSKDASKLSAEALNQAGKYERAGAKLSKFIKILKPLGPILKKAAVVGWLLSFGQAIADVSKVLANGGSAWSAYTTGLYNFLDDMTFGLMGLRKVNEEYIKGLRAEQDAIRTSLELMEMRESRKGEIVGPTIDPALLARRMEESARNSVPGKLEELRTKLAESNKEFTSWLGLLDSGAIALNEFERLTANLAGDLDESNSALREYKLLLGNLPDIQKLPTPKLNVQIGADSPQMKFQDAVGGKVNDVTDALKNQEYATKVSAEAFQYLANTGNYTKEQLAQLAQMLGQELPAQAATLKEQFATLKSSVMSFFGELSSLWQAQISAEQESIDRQNEKIRRDNEAAKLELERLRALGMANTRYYRDKEKAANKEEVTSTKRMRRLKRLQQLMSVSEAVINGAVALTNIQKAWASNPVMVAILSALTTASVATQIATIKAQKFATGGLIQGNPYQDSTQVLAQGGEYIVNQTATERNRGLLESINNGASFGGGNPITINIQGNVLGEDRWVRDNLIPEIKRAVREGHTLAYA